MTPSRRSEFGDRMLEAPRSFADRTSISGAIEFAMAQFARAPFESARRTIDVSGDGTNNSGRDVDLARDEARRQGRHHQRARHPQRHAAAVESRAHQSAGRAGQILPQQCDRRSRRFRAWWRKNLNSFGQAIIEKMIAEVALAREQAPRRAAAAR